MTHLHSLGARLRVDASYLYRHGCLPNYDAPSKFTELVQIRKFQDRDMRMPGLADKVAVKNHVARVLGPEWVIPTLWSGKKLPAHPDWPRPFIVKSRHGCGQYAVVHDGDTRWNMIRLRSLQWMSAPYGGFLAEWLYAHIERGLLAEPYIGRGDVLPVDYKIYVFGGVATFIQLHLERAQNHRWMLFDRDWQRVSSRNQDADPAPPKSLASMLSAAEELSEGFDFVRVDFYECNARPLFGEMTFYPGSGMDPFDPVGLDRVIGGHWLNARQRADERSARRGMPAEYSPETPAGT